MNRNNGQFKFTGNSEVNIKEKAGDMTREPWLMLLTRRNQKPTETLCWGLTNCGTSFARIGTQEGDLVNGFVHEDPYKTRLLGPYAYFVDEDERYFSNSWYPVLHEDQKLETTFGFGYVEYLTRHNSLQVKTTSFIPNEFDGMIQIIKIRNESDKKRTIKMFNVNPINIGDARDIQFSGFNTLMMGGSIIDRDINAVVWRNSYGIPFKDDETVVKGLFGKLAVHTTSLPGSDFATKYDEFVGHFSNTMANPAGLKLDTLPNRDSEELTSALSTILNKFTLEAGEEKEIVVSLIAASTEDYYTKDKKELKASLQMVNEPAVAWKLFENTIAQWDDELSKLKINVPGEKTLGHSFKWLQYQCEMVAVLNRMKSRYHSGFEYGYGFRDILQDLLTLLPYDPRKAGEFIKYVAQQMFSDGTVYHNFYVSAPGTLGFTACDDPLWFIYAVCEYIKESGDFSFLDIIVPYADANEKKTAREGSILEHCLIAIERVWSKSINGLPLMQNADWNDDLSDYDDYVSVMAAQMLYKALNDMIELFNEVSIESELVQSYGERASVVKQSVNERALDVDGNYIRALSPDPSKAPDLGSSKTDGVTFFEPIAWAGYSGIASAEQFEKTMAVLERDLDDTYGIAICQGDTVLTEGKLPLDYTAWKRNAPGKKENGGQFRHLESWYIASLCKYGYGKKAYNLYIKTLPAVASSHDPYNYAAERFVFPEYCSSPASNEHGRAGHTWLTGTAPTRLGVLIDFIFGLKRGYKGLEIDPCVTPEWTEFSAQRLFRETSFTINYSNPEAKEKGVREIRIDGKQIKGSVIPEEYYDRKNHIVDVLMG